MMFVFNIPEETARAPKHHIQTETEYFARDREKLQTIHCPNCKEHELYRGGVYIGCTGCFNYFDEDEIIIANM